MNKTTRTTGAIALILATGALTMAASTARAATTPLTPVGGLHVTSATTGTLTVAWSALPDSHAKVRVQVYDADTLADSFDTAHSAAGDVSGKTGITATGLAAGTAYVLRADAYDGSRNAGWTAPVVVYTQASGANGTQGPTGPAGKDGAPGKDGTVGDVLHNSSAAVMIPAGGEVQAYATCAADTVHGLAPNGTADGYVAVGGGFVIDGGSTGADHVVVTIDRDELTNTAGRGWLVQARNDDTAAHTVAAWVICVSAPADNSGT